jgi:hypothetical protein
MHTTSGEVHKTRVPHDAALDLCSQQISARVLLRYINEELQYNLITCSAFGDIVNQLANLPKNHVITAADLLKPQVFHEIRYITNKKNQNLCFTTNTIPSV